MQQSFAWLETLNFDHISLLLSLHIVLTAFYMVALLSKKRVAWCASNVFWLLNDCLYVFKCSFFGHSFEESSFWAGLWIQLKCTNCKLGLRLSPHILFETINSILIDSKSNLTGYDYVTSVHRQGVLWRNQINSIFKRFDRFFETAEDTVFDWLRILRIWYRERLVTFPTLKQNKKRF